MPHITFEYSENLLEQENVSDLLVAMHKALGTIESFKISEIKSRAYSSSTFLVGDKPSRIFAHITLVLFPGRSLEIQRQAGEKLLDLMRTMLSRSFESKECDLTVEVREMRKETYFKVSSFQN